MWQQVIEPKARVRVDARKRIARVGLAIKAVEFGCLRNKAHHERHAQTGRQATHEQPVLRPGLSRLEPPFSGVVARRHRAAVQTQSALVVCHLREGLGMTDPRPAPQRLGGVRTGAVATAAELLEAPPGIRSAHRRLAPRLDLGIQHALQAAHWSVIKVPFHAGSGKVVPCRR